MAESSSHHPVPHSAKSFTGTLEIYKVNINCDVPGVFQADVPIPLSPTMNNPPANNELAETNLFYDFVQDAPLKLRQLPNPFKPMPTKLTSDKLLHYKPRKSRRRMPPLSSNFVSSPGHILTSTPAPNSLEVQDPPHAPLSKISDHPGHNLDTKTVECLGDIKNSQTSHQDQSVPPLKAPESSAGSA